MAKTYTGTVPGTVARAAKRAVPRRVVARLGKYFRRNGYVRRFDPERRANDRRYKKGDEVRLVAFDEAELNDILSLLQRAGYTPGRPHRAGNRTRVPIYGREVVASFLRMICELPA